MKKKTRSINRCDECGLFRPWQDLQAWTEPDSDFGPERVSYSCKPGTGCNPQAQLEMEPA